MGLCLVKQLHSTETIQLLRLLNSQPLTKTLESARVKLLQSEHLMQECLACGHHFEPSSPKALTCSGACRTQLKRIRQGMKGGKSTRLELNPRKHKVTGRRLLELAEGIENPSRFYGDVSTPT